MMTANTLIRHITIQCQSLRQLETQLNELQANCTHQFTETTTHRECEKCRLLESLHY